MVETLTVLDVVRRSAEFLEKKGVERARLNAEWLVAHSMGLDRMALYLQFDRPLLEKELAIMRENVARRGRREPLQYILGSSQFHNIQLKTDRRALIPRPETEQLVEFLSESIPEIDRSISILDLGTGSGAIAIALAVHFPRATVMATDKSEEALELARENALLCGMQNRVDFVQSDWYSNIDDRYRFDVIVSNPPYLTRAELSDAESEVKDHEPPEALVAEDNGMRDLQAIIARGIDYLKDDGVIWLETGIDQRDSLLAMCRKAGYGECEGLNDWSGRQRFIRARK